MANIVNTQLLVDTNKRSLVKIVMEFDTNVSNSVLINASTLAYALNTSGKIMTGGVDAKSNYRTTIRGIAGNAKTDGYVKLQWQGDTNSSIVVIPNGRFEYGFEKFGAGGDIGVITNPETNATGNILFSIVNASSNNALTLFIDLKKDARDYDAGQTADPTAFNRR